MEGCVRLGREEAAGAAAFAASGCSSISDFLSSTAFIDSCDIVFLQDELPKRDIGVRSLWISAKGVRDREEAREEGSFARFLHALPTSPHCTHLSLQDITFESLEELSALCSAIGSPLCTLRDLSLAANGIEIFDQTTSSANDIKVAARSLVKDALFNNTSLHSLSLRESHSNSSLCPQECLIPALTRTPCSITHLEISLRTLDDVSGILTGLALNTISLTSIHIFALTLALFPEYSPLYTMLHHNTSLESFALHYFVDFRGDAVRMLFASLEKNVHLTSLSLESCVGANWPSASFVLDCLRVNGMLSELDLSHTPLAQKSEAAINAQLARNKESREQVAALKAKGSAQVQPTTVRLFLCGLPFSGKTTLTGSLLTWNTGTSNFAECVPSCARKRMPKHTRGIEVSTIEKDGVKVSLWDMAGQAEYYAFHDQMFPNLSNDATPSLFLFVWNPIQVDLSTGKEIKDGCGDNIIKTLEAFDHEFRYWLRFVASKTLVSFRFKPKLLLVITRADRLQINTTSWINKTFTQCQEDFQGHIQFDMEGVFEMDARDPCEVKDLALHIFYCATSLLNSKPLVYQACDQARTVLADLVHTKPLAPLITKEEFFFICKKHLGVDSREMQEAVALSLNESGDLIYFKSLNLVVVDTQWFCHQIMGDLLYFGNNQFQHKGFFPLEFLEDLLESKVNSTTVRGKLFKAPRSIFAKATRSPTIKGEALVNLLIGLQLACRQDDDQVNSDIFIPASLCTIPRRQVDPWQYLKGDEGNTLTFMGRRLKCKDSVCTFFTPGIFSFLQVTFNNIFKGVEVTLHEDVIAFSRGGVKVLVEFCKHEGRDHFIDVLIHSRLDLDSTIGWAYEEILGKVEKACAERRGIQGVELVYEVIRPCSVKEFVGMGERLGTAVSVEELRGTLSHALEIRGFGADRLKMVFYAWQTTNDSDCVVDLLGNIETLKVIKEYGQKFILDVEDLFGINVREGLCSTSEPEKKVFSSSNSGKERGWIYDEVQGVRKDIQEVHKEIQNVVDDVRKLGQVVLPKVLQRIQELLTFSKDGEVGKLPRLFVVTRLVGLVRRLVGAMIPGLQNVRLELLCEHRSGPHLVADQCGINFATLEDGMLKQGLPYISMFLKLAGVAVKVGALAAGSPTGTVPNFSGLLAQAIDTHKLPTSAPGTSRINFQEGQQWLLDVLSKHNCCTTTQIHEVFGLSRVRYGDSHVGWLCDEHRSEGELCPI